MQKKKRYTRAQAMRIIKINTVPTFYAQCSKLRIKLDKHDGSISEASMRKLKKYKVTKSRGGRPKGTINNAFSSLKEL